MSQPPGYPQQPTDPYGQPGQPPASWPPQPYPPPGAQPPAPQSYPPPVDPYAPPTSGGPYGPTSGGPYAPPTSGSPYPPPPNPYAPGAAPVSPYPVSPQPGQTSGFPPTDPYALGQQGMPPGYPTGTLPPATPPKKKRGLLITMIVLAVALVLCGGGGATAWYLLQGADGKGQANPVDAVNLFLTAVYKEKNVEAANKYVCSTARNKQDLANRIKEIRDYDDKYKSPQYNWPTPTVDDQKQETAQVSVPIKVTTSDDRVAEIKLKIITVNDNGWWVCEITSG